MCVSTLAFTACNPDQDVNGTGTLSLRITDAPTDAGNIAGVYITVDHVEYRHNGKWHEFKSFQGPKTINLLELTEGKTELLGDFIVEAGEYSELRFVLDAASNGGKADRETDLKTYIAFIDGTTAPLYVPSGTQSGYKAKGSFAVPMNGTVFITADFDVRKSVVQSGESGKWILKPVIRLVVNDQAGSIEGTLQNIREGEQYVAYAYANETYTEEEAKLPEEGQIQFPGAVSSTRVHADGSFNLAFLAPGKYDIIISAQDAEGNFLNVVANLDDVEVSSLQNSEIVLTF
ncbi:hypothetical protein D770_03525 [Flammeovirgaceae bacterium 311]|nr:hypothetical protein D770_03525 [Flammeovirgaceae bacterium 311]